MRVCHVITKPELGGAQLSTLNILSGLPKDKYKISVITSPKGLLASEFGNIDGVKFYACQFFLRNINPLYDIFALIHIYLIYRSCNYKIVHTHSSKAGIIGRWAAWLARVPVIIHTVHGWSFNDYQPFILRKFFISLERITANFTAKVICVSKKDIETGLKYKIAPEDKFVLINYGIPLEKFKRPAGDRWQKRKELGISNNDPVVAMISCLKRQKSPIDYIKASMKIYENIPNVNFLLIGDGILKKRCQKALSLLPLNGRFIFAGWRRDVSEILDIVDIVVLTSKWEGMPIALIEALAKGCPVVATNVGGVADLVKDGRTGYIVAAGAYEEVAERVLAMLRQNSLLSRMKREASLSIDNSFSLEIMLKKTELLYDNII